MQTGQGRLAGVKPVARQSKQDSVLILDYFYLAFLVSSTFAEPSRVPGLSTESEERSYCSSLTKPLDLRAVD